MDWIVRFEFHYQINVLISRAYQGINDKFCKVYQISEFNFYCIIYIKLTGKVLLRIPLTASYKLISLALVSKYTGAFFISLSAASNDFDFPVFKVHLTPKFFFLLR